MTAGWVKSASCREKRGDKPLIKPNQKNGNVFHIDIDND